MPQPSPTYDLTLLLSNEAPEEQRTSILADVEQAISTGGGSIERQDDWGTRTLTFPIRHEAEADYHLLQFSGPPTLLESLSHNLRIADGVLRFRIIKAIPGATGRPDGGRTSDTSAAGSGDRGAVAGDRAAAAGDRSPVAGDPGAVAAQSALAEPADAPPAEPAAAPAAEPAEIDER